MQKPLCWLPNWIIILSFIWNLIYHWHPLPVSITNQFVCHNTPWALFSHPWMGWVQLSWATPKCYLEIKSSSPHNLSDIATSLLAQHRYKNEIICSLSQEIQNKLPRKVVKWNKPNSCLQQGHGKWVYFWLWGSYVIIMDMWQEWDPKSIT